MKTLMAILTTLFLLLPVQSMAQADEIPKKILGEMEYFLGSWEAEGKENGEDSTGTFSSVWAVSPDGEKCGLVGKYCYRTGDEVRTGQNLIGWDRETGQFIDFGFNTTGGHGILAWTRKSPTKQTGKVLRVGKGTEVVGKVALEKKGPRKLILERELKTGESARYVFQKVDPPTVKEACGWMIGKWSGEIPGVAKVEWTCEWGPEKRTIICHSKMKSTENELGTGMMSICPCECEGTLKYSAVFSDGASARGTLMDHAEHSTTWRRVAAVDARDLNGGQPSVGTMVFRRDEDIFTMQLHDVKGMDGTSLTGFKLEMRKQ